MHFSDFVKFWENAWEFVFIRIDCRNPQMNLIFCFIGILEKMFS